MDALFYIMDKMGILDTLQVMVISLGVISLALMFVNRK